MCKCGNESRQGQRYCLDCHAAHMRKNRPHHRDLTPEQRKRANCRSYANVYLRRGKLTQEPCACGETNVQMHHEDYDKPLAVEWLCRPCHMERHYV